MRRLIDTLSEHSDLLIAAGIFDIILVIILDMPGRILGGWHTLIGQNNFKGSSSVFLLAFLLGAIVVNIFVVYRISKSYRQAGEIST